jgi:UDP-hydrolysing UDP-N-acetyl-D-glucosamine 2-epimerase
MLNKKNKKRKVLLVTGSRGEYGYIRPLLNAMAASRHLEPKVIATNMHLLPEFGNSVQELIRDGINVDHKIYMSLAGYTNVTMTKSLGIFLLSITDILHNEAPDLILLAGDRGEQMMAALAGAHMNIPVAHIQAGEVSGNVDGMTRHAMARYVHLHLTANQDASRRLIRSGEQSFRIHQVGAPQLDDFVQGEIASRETIARKYSLDLSKPLILVVQHPVTEQAHKAEQQMAATLQALVSFNHQTLVIYPNNDAGSLAIQSCIRDYRNINIKVERNVSRPLFGGLLKAASVLVGNSSSGLIEAPYFRLPAVNIGRRQEGRFQGKNVINVPAHNAKDIEKAMRLALSDKFRKKIKSLESPYGDGQSSKRIIRVLEDVEINEKLLFKKITY